MIQSNPLEHPVALAALLGWIPFVLLLFALLPARRAVIGGILLGWLLLPEAKYPLAGLPDYTKLSAIPIVVFAGALLFDRRSFRALRPRWVDLPMLVWCFCPAAASLSNGLEWYDAASATLAHVIIWGLPYVLGRVYCSDVAGLTELAIGIVVAGLVYVPLCVFEIYRGPLLHALVYGFDTSNPRSTVRFGGWRPTVFMSHGLMVAMFMTAAAIVAFWMWRSGALRRLLGFSTGIWVLVLFATVVAVRSVNGWVLLATGTLLLLSLRRAYGWVLVLCVLVAPPLYVTARITSLWSGKQIVRPVWSAVGRSRAQSLQFRLQQENALIRKARQKLWLGWGGWGRSRLHDAEGRDISVTDSAWIISFGQFGVVGVASQLALFLVPVLTFWVRWPVRFWDTGAAAPGAALAVVLALYAINNCFNCHLSSAYVLVAGGLAGCRR
jgi:hypothetical protein